MALPTVTLGRIVLTVDGTPQQIVHGIPYAAAQDILLYLQTNQNIGGWLIGNSADITSLVLQQYQGTYGS